LRIVLKASTAIAGCYVVFLLALLAQNLGGTKRHHVESAGFIFSVVAAAVLIASRHERPRSPAASGSVVTTVAVAVAAAGCLMLYRALDVGLLSDDFVLKSWAGSGRWLGEGSAFARPAVLKVWRLIVDLGGGPKSLHALNLLLHALNTVLCVTVARRLGLLPSAALAAGAVFVFWPTQIEPVVWNSGMFDVLMTSFVLTCIAINPFAAGRSRPMLLAAIVAAAAAALLCKETAIAVPLLWAVCYAPKFNRDRWFWCVFGCLCGLCVAYVGSRYLLGLPLSSGTSLTRYVLKEQLSRTIGGLALPLTDPTAHAHPWAAVLLAATAVAAALMAVVPASDGAEYASVQGVLWALIAAAPTIGYLFIGPDLEGSRYLYLPCVGWGLFVAAALERARRNWWTKPMWALAAAALVVAVSERQGLAAHWTDAASLRDSILDQAVIASHRHDCRAVIAIGLPARVRGAQLFNNGFAEAFDARPDRRVDGSRVCQLEWSDGAFIQR
jgi:hypothetical protein